MTEFSAATVSESATILEALAAIDKGACGLCCVVSDDGHLRGVLTDGDLRRALIQGAQVREPAWPFATASPRTVPVGMGRAHVLDLLRSLGISAAPVVDTDGRLAGLHTLSEVLGRPSLPNPAVIMAGGRGTRLGERTKHTPKPLMTVAGRPILEWIVLGLVSDGICDITVSVNYRAQQIIDCLGDGAELGCSISYLHESEHKPLDTGGSLTLFRQERPEVDDPVLVMNGDLMVEFDAAEMLAHHARHDAAMTVASRSYEHTIPYGVLTIEVDGRVREIEEKPAVTRQINTAIYAVEPRVIDTMTFGEPTTMPEVMQSCIRRGDRVLAWDLSSEWIDVGTPRDLDRAKGNLHDQP